MFQGFFQRHGENMFTTSLPDVKTRTLYLLLYIISGISQRLYLIERLKKVGIFFSQLVI